MEDYSGTNFMSYVRRSRDAMLPFDNLDPKGMVKQQLRMELNSGKCSCVVDALCMQSWKNINIRKLKAMECELKGLFITMHHVFYRLVSTRVGRLHICESLVTYPLSAGNIYGSWDSEVLEVVEHADLKRRSDGRRFIGTDHLVFCLHQMLLVSESVHVNGKKGLRKRKKKKKKKAQAENSKVLWMPSDDDEEKHKDTVYHLYRKAYEIATELGHEKIGLEHLCVAITSSANDDKSSWKVSVERVRRAKKKRKCKCEEEEEEEDEAHPKLWEIIIGEEELGLDEMVDIVKKIKDESNIPLQRAISNVLSSKDDQRTHQMSEGEMINSLKKI